MDVRSRLIRLASIEHRHNSETVETSDPVVNLTCNRVLYIRSCQFCIFCTTFKYGLVLVNVFCVFCVSSITGPVLLN